MQTPGPLLHHHHHHPHHPHHRHRLPLHHHHPPPPHPHPRHRIPRRRALIPIRIAADPRKSLTRNRAPNTPKSRNRSAIRNHTKRPAISRMLDKHGRMPHRSVAHMRYIYFQHFIHTSIHIHIHLTTECRVLFLSPLHMTMEASHSPEVAEMGPRLSLCKLPKLKNRTLMVFREMGLHTYFLPLSSISYCLWVTKHTQTGYFGYVVCCSPHICLRYDPPTPLPL